MSIFFGGVFAEDVFDDVEGFFTEAVVFVEDEVALFDEAVDFFEEVVGFLDEAVVFFDDDGVLAVFLEVVSEEDFVLLDVAAASTGAARSAKAAATAAVKSL